MRRGKVMVAIALERLRTCRGLVAASALLTLSPASIAAPVLLQCDLTMVRGNKFLCEADPGFCQQALLVDSDAKTVEIMPTTKFSRASRKARVHEWTEAHVVFYEEGTKRQGSADDPGYIKETRSTLNRITGAYADWWEYKTLDGKIIPDEEVQRRDAAAKHMFDGMPVYEREGQCKPAKPLF